MERMKQLQECRDDEEASQEEMATRFEREKTESMLVVTAEDEESAPSRDISRHFEDPSYGYKEFSRRGEHVPTLRVQVQINYSEQLDPRSLSRSFTLCFSKSSGLQLGGSRLLPGQQTLPRRRSDAGREVPAGLQSHLQHHGDAQGCGHQHAASGHLELHPLHVRHQVGPPTNSLVAVGVAGRIRFLPNGAFACVRQIRRLRLRGDQPAPGPQL